MQVRSMDTRLMVKVARLYFQEGLTQEEISRRYHTSRSTVSRLLKQAKDLGIVTVAIHEPFESRFAAMEDHLERVFGLQEAVVVEAGVTPDDTRDALAHAAAAYLFRAIRPGQVISVSWGVTLQRVIELLDPPGPIPVKVVPLVGGSGLTDPELHANQIAIGLARRLGGEWVPLHAPAVSSSREVRDAFLSDSGVHRAMELAERSDVALVGVGSTTPAATVMQTGYLHQLEMEAIRAQGAVGDAYCHYFNAEGQLCVPQLSARVIGLPLDKLKRIPLVIGVAGGVEKIDAVAGALRGGYVKTLVTDTAVAAGLLGAHSLVGVGR